MIRSSIGLDIRDNIVRVVGLIQKKEGVELTKYGSISIPESNPGLISGKTKTLFQTLSIKEKVVSTSLRGSFILTRAYDMSFPDFASWAGQNFSQIVPGIPPEQAVIDYDFISEHKVLIIVARKEVLNEFVELIRKSDLIPSIIDASNLPLIETFRNHAWLNDGKPVAIMDLSSDSLSMVVTSSCRPLASSEIKLAKAKKREFNGLVLHEAIRLFDYYQSRDGLEVNNLILTGEKASESLARFMRKNLKKEIELGDPFKHMKTHNDISDRLSYAQAAGLARKGLAAVPNKPEINLTPKEIRQEIKNIIRNQELTRLAKALSLVFGSIVVLFIFFNAFITREITNLTKSERELSSKLAGLSEYESFFIDEKVTLVKELLDRKITWSRILRNVGLISGKNLQFTTMNTETRLISESPDNVITQTLMNLEGEAASKESVVSAIAGLEKDKGFKIKRIDKIEEDDGKWQFKIVCELNY